MKSIPAQTASAIRKELKKVFPSIEFSVMSQSYTGGSSVRISYTDGIKTSRVQAIVDKYSYETKRDESIPQTRFVFVSRQMSVDTCVLIGEELGIKENEIAHPIERFGGEYGTAVIRRTFCEREFGIHAQAVLSVASLNEKLAVKVVTDHPEAEAIDAAFDASNLQKFFFTCGQAHSHDVDGSTWNKDSVLQVMAVDENAARELVFSRFGAKWSHQYDEADMNFEYFPNGICAIIYA